MFGFYHLSYEEGGIDRSRKINQVMLRWDPYLPAIRSW